MTATTRIYVASSWRNVYQPGVVALLRQAGHDVYDFRHPAEGNDGFGWRDVDPHWLNWLPDQLRAGLQHPVAQAGFGLDFDAMKWADELCLVLPSGRSAHLEAGWAMGAGKRCSVYIPVSVEPELMYLLAGPGGSICTSLAQVLEFHGKAVTRAA